MSDSIRARLVTRRRFLKASLVALASTPLNSACQSSDVTPSSPTPGSTGAAGSALGTPTPSPVLLTPTPANTPTPEIVRLSYWHFGGTTRWREQNRSLVDQYNSGQGQTRVELSDRDWARQSEDILTAINGGSAPNLVHVHSKYVAEFGKMGVLQPMDSFPDWPQFSSKFLPGYVEMTAYAGKHYGLGIHPLPFVLASNRTMLAEVGLKAPETWDTFRQAAVELSRPEESVYGYTIPAGLNIDTSYRWVAWLYGNGGSVLNDDWSKATFHEQAGIEALEMLVELQRRGCIAPGVVNFSFDENADQWGMRKAAMSTEGPWWQKLIVDEYNMSAEEVLTISRHPFSPKPSGKLPPATLVDMPMLAILSGQRSVEATWEFHKWLRSEENDLKLVEPGQGDGLPMVKKAYAPEVKWKLIGRDAFRAAAEAVRPWPYHLKWAAIQNKVAEACHAALSGADVTAEEVLTRAAESVDEIVRA